MRTERTCRGDRIRGPSSRVWWYFFVLLGDWRADVKHCALIPANIDPILLLSGCETNQNRIIVIRLRQARQIEDSRCSISDKDIHLLHWIVWEQVRPRGWRVLLGVYFDTVFKQHVWYFLGRKSSDIADFLLAYCGIIVVTMAEGLLKKLITSVDTWPSV